MQTESVTAALSGWLAEAALKAHVDWGTELQRMRDLAPLPFPPLQPPPFHRHPPSWEPTWWPINSAQQMAINSRAELLLFGGQSGGGKTSFLAADAMQEYRNPYLKSLILRTTKTEMGELSDQMQKLYEPIGAKWRRPNKFEDYAWVFPNGGHVTPGYIRNEKDLNRYQGNPKSHLGLDESGQHAEKLIRRLLGWLAAPRHSGLFVRARFGSNPGGPGHGWQSSVFLRGRCPVHYPAPPEDDDPTETSVLPGRVYKGARWPSDGAPVYKTTTFIPARLIDNPLYDRVKLESLLTQTADIREQLLYGCWCNAEGLYFPFLRPEYMVPFQTIKREWWWGHFISIDYGYGNSAAAAGLYTIAPSGVVYKVAERIEKKMHSKEFARRIVKDGFTQCHNPRQGPSEAWTKKLRPRDPEGPRILWAQFDPANDQHTGTGKSNYQIMGEVFNEAGIPTILSAHDPMGNAQSLYGGLANHELVITTACPYTFNTLTSRVVDERKAVKKEKGNPQDDCYDECLAPGTMIETPAGKTPIEELRQGAVVLTRSGEQSVLWAGVTDFDAALYRVTFSNGKELVGTANHPVFVFNRGFVPLSELKYGDNIWACPERRLSSTEAFDSDAIPTRRTGTTAPISARPGPTGSAVSKTFIGKSTNTRLAPFPKGSLSITAMRTRRTTLPRTSNSSPTKLTGISTFAFVGSTLKAWPVCANMPTGSVQRRRPGTVQPRAANGIPNTPRPTGLIRNSRPFGVPVVVPILRPMTREITSTALENARRRPVETLESTMKPVPALVVAENSKSTATASSSAAPVFVRSVSTGGRGKVYNLTVAVDEEFFANGVLVHNCSYAWNTWKEESIKPAQKSLEEELDEMRREGIDETSIARHAWKRYLEIRAAEQKEAQGIPLGGKRIGRRITRR